MAVPAVPLPPALHTHTHSKYSKKAAGSEHGDVSQGGGVMRWLPEDHAVKINKVATC